MQKPPDGAANVTVAQAMQHAFAAYQRGDLPLAERTCRAVLAVEPRYFDALHLLAMVAIRTQRAAEAAQLLAMAVSVNPGSATAHNNHGVVLMDLGRAAEAVASYDRALALNGDYADAHYNRGVALTRLGRHADAAESYERTLALQPGYVEAWFNRGIALTELKRYDEAVASYDRAIALKPDYADAYNNRGNALRDLKRDAEALASYEHAIALNPRFAEAFNNRGVALADLNQHARALESYERAIAIRPDYADAHNHRAAALVALKRQGEALEGYARALALKPDYADAHYNRGIVLRGDLKRHAEALQSFAAALKLDPDYEFLYGDWLYTRMLICDWEGIEPHFARLAEKIERGETASPPFPVLAMSDSPAVHLQAARTWVRQKYPAAHKLPPIPQRIRRDKIRLGYFSTDFREHAVSHLMAELFERHRKSRFHLTAFSFGSGADDAMRTRVASAFDAFVDVRALSDSDVAQRARSLDIDIAIDLNGFTGDARTGIFALRAAPIQVNYLGYPGTMGAEYIDYLIADATVIPEESRRHYTESIAYLPDCYQPGDTTRRIADTAISREAMGLPPTGFVFCSFNNNYKITPAVFDCWMRLLARVDGSVLWLREDNEWAARNLRKEAARRGMAESRLIFAERLPSMSDHLARHRLADLFLDTMPYNAHTTANDALWAGLPVLTCPGETLVSRAAASLLSALRLPELIAATPDAYERIAFELATDPARLRAIRQRLDENRLTTPLFDIASFARHIEAAYTAMYERYIEGLAPADIRVER